MSAAHGVSRAPAAMRRTAPRSRPRTSSSVITSLADSSRVTLLEDEGVAAGPEEVTGLERSGSVGAALLNTSRTSARTRSLVASSAILERTRQSLRSVGAIENSPAIYGWEQISIWLFNSLGTTEVLSYLRN